MSTIVIIGDYDEKQNQVSIKNISGLEQHRLQKLLKILKINPIGKTYPLREDIKNIYDEQKIVEIKGGLIGLSENEYPAPILKKVEKLLDLKKIYTIGLRRGNQLFAWIHIFKFNQPMLKNKELIEIFLSQSSIILQKKFFEEKNEELANIVTQSDDAIIQTDRLFNITYMNPKAEKLYGYKSEEVIGKTPELFNAESSAPEIQKQIYDTVSKGETFFGEYINQRKDGNTFWCQIKISPLVDQHGKTYGYISSQRDITEQKKAEKEITKAHQKLSQINKDLEQKVKERTIRISKLLKQKDEFINQLGHDLKNPLGPLINLIPLVENHVNDPKDKKILKVTRRNVNYMKNLVEKTLELARLNSPNTKLSLKKFNLKAKIEETLERNSLMFEEKNISINLSIPQNIKVIADQLLIEELFNNLLNNAVKYNKENGTITIDGQADEQVVTISIKDDGIGMTAEQLIHIFDEFYKADESRHDFDSSGLGMPICKRIIDKHNGKIWAESDGPGEGSTFYFTLPLNKDKQLNENEEQLNENEEQLNILSERKEESISEKVDFLLSIK